MAGDLAVEVFHQPRRRFPRAAAFADDAAERFHLGIEPSGGDLLGQAGSALSVFWIVVCDTPSTLAACRMLSPRAKIATSLPLA